MTFSSEWTAEERLKLVIVVTNLIRDDVTAGRYGGVGRPNIQAVHILILSPADVLEQQRHNIDNMVEEVFKGDDRAREEFFGTSLEDFWSGKTLID